MFPPSPVVLDTSGLLPDVLAAARNGGAQLLDQLEQGTLIGYAPHHVWAEAPRTLAGVAERQGVDPIAAEATWWERYVPLIRFVDTDGLSVGGIGAGRLAQRDASDIPTAALVGLIGPVAVVAADRDLIDTGFAHPARWLPAVAGSYQQEAEHQGQAVIMAGALTVQAMAAGLSGTAKLAARPGVVGMVATLASVVALVALIADVGTPDSKSRRLGRTLGTAALMILSAAAEARQRAVDTMGTCSVGAPGENLDNQVARYLATAAVPVPVTTLAAVIGARTGVAPRSARLAQQISRVLESRPAFVRHATGWTLGRADIAFRAAHA